MSNHDEISNTSVTRGFGSPSSFFFPFPSHFHCSNANFSPSFLFSSLFIYSSYGSKEHMLLSDSLRYFSVPSLYSNLPRRSCQVDKRREGGERKDKVQETKKE